MSYFSLFQSPHPVRGATGSRSCWPPSQCHFNPRTPRGVRREAHYDWSASYIISIHAPREGCDMGGGVAHGIDCISIHAPREGCDAMGGGVAWLSLYFNPRTPRGVRRAGAGCSGGGQPIFQSTHPARGATWRSLDAMEPIVISIHAPREGCDWWWKMVCSYRCHFNPRTPRGVRPRGNGNASKRTTNFNPRTPRGVRRRTTFPTSRSPAISIHAPREGCDSKIRRFNIINKNFNPRTPRGVRL